MNASVTQEPSKHDIMLEKSMRAASFSSSALLHINQSPVRRKASHFLLPSVQKLLNLKNHEATRINKHGGGSGGGVYKSLL